MNKVILSILLFLCAGSLQVVSAQTSTPSAIKPVAIVGDVVSIGDNKIVIATKTGPVEIATNDKSAFKRVAAENPNLAQATPGAFSDISVGDKLTVSVLMGTDGKPSPARTVYFITKASIDEKNRKESAEWQRRGVMGKVTAVNPQTNQITIESRGLTGTTSIVITPKEGALFKRYAPDSIRYDEALPSSVADTKVGDMARALGEKSSDGLSVSAEQVITGAFQTIAGTVKSIDAAKNEVVLKNLQTGKDVTVSITENSVLKKFPAEQAEMLARAQMMGMGGGARPMGQPGAGGPPAGAAPGGAPGQGRPGGMMMGGRGASGGIDDILERSPSITVSDLKAGDIIAFSSTKTSTDRFQAIKLFAGVEPFLRAAQAGGRRGGGGVEGGFSIPGLDGMGMP
jgi:ribosomal protein L24